MGNPRTMPALRNLLLISLGLLCACAAPPVQKPARVAAPAPLTQPYAARAQAGQSVYRLENTDSKVWILVDKTGPLASFGHEHVIEVGHLEGFAHIDAKGSVGADVRFAVKALKVDSTEALKHFNIKENLSEEDRAGTRRHMLGTDVLDANHYPWVNLKVDIPQATSGTVPLAATIALHGEKQSLNLTGTMTREHSDWKISGNFSIKQTAFGITPYSVMLGALRVKDKIRIRYDLTFSPWQP